MILISCIGQLFCGMACVTSASRMTYAFSRDRAIPGWRIWTRLNHNRTPVGAVLFVVACALIITLPALWNVEEGIPVAFFAVVSVCVIGLYIAYVDPDLPALADAATSSSPARGTTARSTAG